MMVRGEVMIRPTFSRRLDELARRQGGVALVEFALLLPIFALLCVATIDFGLAFYSKLRLSEGVAQGAQYAFMTGALIQTSQVQTVVQTTSGLSGVAVNVNYNSNACYCLSGSPAAEVAQACGSPCANGAPPGKFMSIAATYAYSPIFAGYNLIADPTIAENATVRVQ
jgi:Flp pilus assembly protein TadG